jgi:hypothetical protein
MNKKMERPTTSYAAIWPSQTTALSIERVMKAALKDKNRKA